MKCSHFENTRFLNPDGGCRLFSRPCVVCISKVDEVEGENDESKEKELLLCCTCGKVLCSGYGHMESHFKQNKKHCISFSLKTLSFYCFECENEFEDVSLMRFSNRLHYYKFNRFPVGYNVFSFGLTKDKKESYELFQNLISNEFIHFTPMVESIDMVSKRCGMGNLQNFLRDQFGRKIGDHDGHGVRNYTVKKTISSLSSHPGKFVDICPKLKLPVERLINEANSFRVFYLQEFTSKNMIKRHFEDKESRFWNFVFEKHFYISTSDITILYDHKGLPFSQKQIEEQKNRILLVTAVGFDTSANRHLGVHFGDFLSVLTRKDGKDVFEVLHKKKKIIKNHQKKKTKTGLGEKILGWFSGGSTKKKEKKEKEEEEEEGEEEESEEKKKKKKKKKDIRKTELWDDSYGYWTELSRVPKQKYILNEKRLGNFYSMIFSLTFHALQTQGIEVPIVCALGCGVFGRCFFPEYHQTVIRTYIQTLNQSKDHYGFKGLILCEVSPKNIEIFKKVLDEEISKEEEKNNLPPILICQNDILGVVRLVSKHHTTSLLNAGDLWEFGQYWEGGAALEEYIARMTTSYFSQHFMINPEMILDQKNYIGVSLKDLDCEIEENEVKNLQEFIMKIKMDYF